MKFAQAYFPKKKLNQPQTFVLVTFTLFIIVMLVSQLITIEKFIPIIERYNMFTHSADVQLFVCTLLVCGVFGLPFLLRMKLSPLFRIFSAVLLNIYALMWLYLSFWQAVYTPSTAGIGYFGSLLADHIPSKYALIFGSALILFSLAVTYILKDDLTFSLKKLGK